MSAGSVSSLLPPVYQPLQQVQNAPKPAAQNTTPPAQQAAATDSDGDNDGSGGASASSKVNITA